uniref:Uncharacterized protein n=1 Tax=Rhizophora mucronata TaxID=61149 RepID=A0A2P2PDW6_RHIMU
MDMGYLVSCIWAESTPLESSN